MVSKSAWKIGLSLAALAALAAPRAAQATCPASCPTRSVNYFTEVQRTNAITLLAQGGTAVTEDHARGVNIYKLNVTADQADAAADARASSCPVTVHYSTRGDFLRSGSMDARFFGDIETILIKSLFGVILDMRRVAGNAPPLAQGNYIENHQIAVAATFSEGDTFAVEAVVGADATAIGPTTGDYASAQFRMYQGGSLGAPMLEICTP